ncbi:MAG: Ig-like domain-containing protein [Thermoplasmata archaeon]|nr:Ig-like domain-containing protein [Thermoplasmata archaeon]RLF64446.1 MAG: carboxypeptidase regulatory-like domain-containing protein [Thermoplasmata archaeon]
MEIRGLIGDKRAIEGLPMRLIILVVIAGVVLAAIITMIPHPKGNLQVECVSVDGNDGNLKTIHDSGRGEVSAGDFDVVVKVTDDKGKAISGASVTLTGANGAGSGKTGDDGTAVITVTGVKLNANEDVDYMKVTVTASGYHKYEEENFIVISRVG